MTNRTFFDMVKLGKAEGEKLYGLIILVNLFRKLKRCGGRRGKEIYLPSWRQFHRSSQYHNKGEYQ